MPNTTTVVITSQGGKAKIVINLDDDALYPQKNAVDMSYNTTDVSVSISFSYAGGRYSYPSVPIANVTIGGVVITSQAVFDTQVTTVFPNTNSGSGGSGDGAPQFAATYTAANALSTKTGFVRVIADENYGGQKSMYLFLTDTTLEFQYIIP